MSHTQHHPSLMPARCIFTLLDQPPAIEAVMPPSTARALHTLLSARVDRHTVRKITAYPINYHSPRALFDCAVSLSHWAQKARAARWDGKPTPRLDKTFFPAEIETAQTLAVIGHLIAAATLGDVCGAKGLDEMRAELTDFVAGAYRYPSIAPRVEAELAAEGMTTAELLLTLACKFVIRIADAYSTASGEGAHTLHKIAKEARDVAQDALEVLDAGVAHTLCS